MIVVNLFGGPGSGKSTIMAGLFWLMRTKGIKCEMASEFVKESVFAEDNYVFKDQGFVFSNQLKRLRVLEGKTDYAITDSPLLFSKIYGGYHSPEFHCYIDKCINEFKNVNFIINRKVPFEKNGRVHSERESAEIDTMIRLRLNIAGMPYTIIDGTTFAPLHIFSHLTRGD